MTINGLAGTYANQVFPLSDTMLFGRNAGSCNVLFSDDTKGVSRTHCKVENTPNGVTITDLGSSYGTFVNGVKLQPYAPRKLNIGDTFYLGDKSNLFSLAGNPSAVPIPGSDAVVNNPNDKSLLIAALVFGAVILIGFIVYMIQRASHPSLQEQIVGYAIDSLIDNIF